MLKLIIGVKGTGKTKTLIEMVNKSLETTKGDVVVIEKGNKLIHDVKHQARLIDTDEYMICDAQSLFGFVAGILASNYDVTDLYIDSALKICGNDLSAFDTLIDELNKLSEKANVNIQVTSSIPVEEASETVKKYI
ncbi:MAG: hypothetical protein IJC15_08980 [Clostridia bacterium]|nr:hypothetical protein [Clostridia bacterium]